MIPDTNNITHKLCHVICLMGHEHMLPLITLPTPSLRERSRALTRAELLSSEMQNFCQALIPAMYAYQGIGLAAPQVDKNIRICVIGKEADKSLSEDLILVNPEIEILNRKKTVDSEGCLSVPNTSGKVKRAEQIRVRAWNLGGEPIEFVAKNLFARVCQHELDHLNGVLFIERATGVMEKENS